MHTCLSDFRKSPLNSGPECGIPEFDLTLNTAFVSAPVSSTLQMDCPFLRLMELTSSAPAPIVLKILTNCFSDFMKSPSSSGGELCHPVFSCILKVAIESSDYTLLFAAAASTHPRSQGNRMKTF